jgi:hypothetical protein
VIVSTQRPDPSQVLSPVHGIAGQPQSPLHDTTEVPSGDWIYCPNSTYMRRFRYFRAFNALDVEFASGQMCRYFDVPWSIYFGLVDAPSKGKYSWAKIRNVYKFEYI